MRCPVSLATDRTNGLTTHVKGAPFYAAWDGTAPMNWPPSPEIKHKLAATVLHKKQALVQTGHDLGPKLPHYPYHPLAEANSSRKMVFGASTVKACGAAIGATDGWLPMLVCGDIPLPNGGNRDNSTHTVFVGLTDADLAVGGVEIAFSTGGKAVMTYLKARENPIEFVMDCFAIASIKSFRKDEDKSLKDLILPDPKEVALDTYKSLVKSYIDGSPITVSTAKGTSSHGASVALSIDPTTHEVKFKAAIWSTETEAVPKFSGDMELKLHDAAHPSEPVL